MSKCPNCEKEINQLKFEKDVRQRGIIKIDKDGDLEYLIDQPDEELIIADYFCPLCNECIDVEDLEDFLKDKFQIHKSELIKALKESKGIFTETCKDIFTETIESVEKSINSEDIENARKHLEEVVNFRLALMQNIHMSLIKDKILKKEKKMITNHDFRYDETLRIIFDTPVGISSYGFKTEEALKQFYDEFEFEEKNSYTFEDLIKCNKLGKKINNIITKSLKKYVIKYENIILDWRDDLELEIHNINPDKYEDSIIQEINSKLKELLGE